jgi:hypothetical protein
VALSGTDNCALVDDPPWFNMAGRGQNQVTADEVSQRVIAAFAVDRRLPRVKSPKAPGGSHPPVWRSEEERLEVAQARKAQGIRDDEPVRIHPSHDEIAEMEGAFAWLPPVAAANREAYEALRIWAKRMAEPVATKGKHSLRSIAAGLGMPPMKLIRRKDRALSIIVERLNAPTLH